jgi:hypothetical protein
MNKPFTILARMAAAGALIVFASHAQGQNISVGNLYQDSTGYRSENLNGNTTEGNEIVLAGSSAYDQITSFSFQFDYTGSSIVPAATADVTFYQNDGGYFDGTTYAAPGTQIWTSGLFPLGGYTAGLTQNFYPADINGGAGVVVPQDFTWVVTFGGLQDGESAGLALYSPATVGANYGDAWVNNGSGWVLDTALAGNPPIDFGAVFNGVAVVPEPSCSQLFALSVLAGFGWIKRFQRRG